jgi:drug/metabolite transporter (DMT)-like permease
MFWGVLWGWVFWGDFPDGFGWVGIAVIIAAGLLVIRAPQKEKAAPEGAA